jgi:hypothetical protein
MYFKSGTERLQKVRPGTAKKAIPFGVMATLLITGSALAQDVPFFGLYGTPGLIDMPSADMAPDATLSTSMSHFAGTTRSTITFQVAPPADGQFPLYGDQRAVFARMGSGHVLRP